MDFSKDVYIKKLGSHELGARKGQPNKAGAFILISKKYLDYFPRLSKDILNDRLCLKLGIEDQSFMSAYTYHNSVKSKSRGRNELRIYLNKKIKDKLGSGLTVGNYIIFDKIIDSDNISYKVYVMNKTTAELRTADTNNPTSSFMLPKSQFYKIKGLKRSIHKLPSANVIDDKLLRYPVLPAVRLSNDISRKARDSSFRSIILFLYEEKCAITGISLKYNSLVNLESAHIRAVQAHQGGGSDHPSNGIALSRDLHWAFDNGFFTFKKKSIDHYSVLLHPESKKINYLKPFNNKKIFIPERAEVRPNEQSIEWHEEKVFGKFCR